MVAAIHYRINTPAVVSEFFDNEVILVNMNRGHYYSLRDTAATLWHGLDAGLSDQALATRLTADYSIDFPEAMQAVQVFLQQALEQDLLVATDQPVSAKPLPAPATQHPFNVPILEIYTDMEDLLGLDPIHDVNPQQGWPIQK